MQMCRVHTEPLSRISFSSWSNAMNCCRLREKVKNEKKKKKKKRILLFTSKTFRKKKDKINQVEFDLKENHHLKACKSLHSCGPY